MKRALIVWGGWDGHQPQETAEVMEQALTADGFEVEVSTTQDAYQDEAKLKSLDLIINNWTMGDIAGDQLGPLLSAVQSGVGFGGIHGGMCDAYRAQTEYQFMCGGQWVAHPGGIVTYGVHILDPWNPLTAGIEDFEITSEQYFMHVDPGNVVLATTSFGHTVMPVIWLKRYGQGRVYYCSLGHVAADVRMPQVLELVTRGMLWAAEGEG